MMDKTVHIIGGGIGGLTLANALQHHEIPYALYEQAPALTEVGAGIGLAKAAIDILRNMGMYDELKKHGAVSDTVFIPDKNLNIRRKIHTSSEVICIHRARLIDVLKKDLDKNRIHLSKKAVSAAISGNKNSIRFEDGSELESDCTVAADGVGSAIRNSIFPDITIRWANQTVWRGITEIDIPKEYETAFIEIWDENLRFLTIPIDSKNAFWLAIEPVPPGGKDNPDTIREELLEKFQNFHPYVKELISKSQSFLRNDLGDLGSQKRDWHKGSLVFLGDAIHATTPNLAQGGCQAIEDAWCLAKCLNKYGDDLETAYSTYYKLRHKKAMSIVKTSWTFGNASLSKNPLFHYGYRSLLTHAPEFVLRKQESILSDLSYLEEFKI